MVTVALRLVSLSVAFGLVSGGVSVITGLRGHSLGVLAAGLDVLAGHRWAGVRGAHETSSERLGSSHLELFGVVLAG